MAEFHRAPSLIRVLKFALAASSAKLSWETIKGLLGISVFQSMWRPPQKQRHQKGPATSNLPSFPQMMMHWDYVDEIKGARKFVITPQARLMTDQEYKTDYTIAIAEKILMKPVVLFEVKKCVSANLQTAKAKDRPS